MHERDDNPRPTDAVNVTEDHYQTITSLVDYTVLYTAINSSTHYSTHYLVHVHAFVSF